jgi:hypothetical protein
MEDGDMKKSVWFIAALLLGLMPELSRVDAATSVRTVMRFSTMYGVDGPFVGDAHPIRGIPGDDLPWKIRSAEGVLLSDGTVSITVRGLVFTNDPTVPADLRGINDEPKFRAIVSCLTEGDDDTPPAQVATPGFTANRNGDSQITARVHLPNPCVAPIIFVVAADEDDWLAVTGVETN